MKKFKITKEQILLLAEQHSWSESKLKEWFPQAFESELETGKWYKGNRRVLAFCTKTKSNTDFYGYGFGYDDRNWCDEDEITWYCKEWALATDKEVETALIDEAKKRGFKANIKITHNGLLNEKGKSIPEGERNILNSKFEYEKNVLRQNGHIIYSNGKWAEIISEPIEVTLEQRIERIEEQLKIKK